MTLETASEIPSMHMKKIFIQITRKIFTSSPSAWQWLQPVTAAVTNGSYWYQVHMHGAKREFFKNDFVQDLRMIWFLFKLIPENGRSVFLAQTHFLLIFLLPLLKHQGKNSIKINKFSIKKNEEEEGKEGLYHNFCGEGKAQVFHWNLVSCFCWLKLHLVETNALQAS